MPRPKNTLFHKKRNNDRLAAIVTGTHKKFNSWKVATARHDESCDGSHFACVLRQVHGAVHLSLMGIWETDTSTWSDVLREHEDFHIDFDHDYARKS